jgi:PIN domain nuclease of toxin-antitoxin system
LTAPLLDAYALIAFLRGDGEPAAREVRDLLLEGALISAVNLAEAVDQLVRHDGIAIETLRGDLAPLFADDHLSVVPAGELDGWLAGRLRGQHYHRNRCPISMADCFLLAAAALRRAPLATGDGPVAEVARIEDVGVVALPERRGIRP